MMTYTQSVAALLELGAVDEPPTYAVTADDIPSLQTLLCDESLYGHDDNDARSWVMTHAVWALIQLDSAAASQDAFLQVVGRALNPAHLWQALAVGFSKIGQGTVPALTDVLRERADNIYVGGGVLDALFAIAVADENAYPDVASAIIDQLQYAADNDPTVNGTIIKWLTFEHIESALPLIEDAYKTDNVDKFLAGDWASVQVDFGLKEEDLDLGKNSMQLYRELGDDWKDVGSKTDSKAAARKKKKRKQAKASRKKNRKR
jgi:hypothetical protein